MTDTKSILDLADAIAAALEARDDWAIAFRPAVQLRPTLELSQTDEIKVLIVPADQSFAALDRESLEWQLAIDVGVFARCDTAKSDEPARPLLALVVEIAAFMVGRRFAGFDVGVATSVPDRSPAWIPEKLDQGAFLSVLRIPFSATLERAD